MPIYDQGYRPYQGELKRGTRAPIIAWWSLRPRLTKQAWGVLFLASIVFIVRAITLIFAPVTVGYSGAEAYSIRFVSTGGGGMYALWSFMEFQVFAALLVPALIAGGVLGEDRRCGALHVYFARPVSRFDYLLGKFLALTVLVAAVTGLPAILLWIEMVVLARSPSFLIESAFAPFSIVVATCLYSVYASSITLALSAVFEKKGLVAVGVILFILFTRVGLAAVMSLSLDQEAWQAFGPDYTLGALTAPLFGIPLPDHLAHPGILFLGLGIPAALLAFTWARMRAVEVAT